MTKLFCKLSSLDNGYDSDKVLARTLDPDTVYEVSDVSMGDIHTDIIIDGKNGYFNSVNLAFFKANADGTFVPHDIFADPKYNPFLKQRDW